MNSLDFDNLRRTLCYLRWYISSSKRDCCVVMDLYSVPSLGHAHSLYTTYHTLGYPPTVPVICSIAIRFHQYTALHLHASPHEPVVFFTLRGVYITLHDLLHHGVGWQYHYTCSDCYQMPAWPLRPIRIIERKSAAEDIAAPMTGDYRLAKIEFGASGWECVIGSQCLCGTHSVRENVNNPSHRRSLSRGQW